MKRLAGNPGHRALNKKEPKLQSVIPDCPSHLTGVARMEWDRITNELHAVNLISRLDMAALAAYCSAYGDYTKACHKLAREGEVIITERGDPKQNPWARIKKSSIDQLVKIAAEFGMTPSSRARVKMDAPSEEDIMASFLFGQKAKVRK